jgi:glycine betaine/proline transport system ATP-binding protein
VVNETEGATPEPGRDAERGSAGRSPQEGDGSRGPRSAGASIVAEGVTKVFGEPADRALALLAAGREPAEIYDETGMTVAVCEASFEVFAGELLVVMGLSGSGKSTLLRMVNRLVDPSAGRMSVAGQDVGALAPAELVALRRQRTAMVFQHFALLPHLTILENAAFGLEVAGVPRREQHQRARAVLEQVGLEAYADAHPDELSGGMQQRVGLARALAVEPDILLMDEAFSALDPLIRSQMQDELIQLQQGRSRTILFVSHDPEEALKLGDRIAIMDAGRIVQIGTPREVVEAPATDLVREFFQGREAPRRGNGG